MENFNCTTPQVEEEQRLYENLRNWDDEIINQKMEDLGIPNVKLSSKRKYILGMCDTLANIDTKKFFLRNSDFMEIVGISKTPFIETIKYFSKLGIIKRISGVRGTASQYKFYEKNLKKLPLEDQTLNGKNNQTLNDVSASVPSVSSEYSLVKRSGGKQSIEDQTPHTQSHTQSHLQEQYEEGLIMNKIDNNKMEELFNKFITSIDFNIIKELNEKLDKISTSIDNNTRVQSEVITKLIEIKTLQEENNKLQESLNKEVTVTTNGKETNHSSSTSIEDKILSHQLDVVSDNPIKDNAWKQEQQKKALQEARQEQSQKIDTKTTVQENNSNEGETNYVLKKLDNLKNGWIEKINTVTTEEQLFEYSDSSLHQFSDFAKIHVGFQRESDKTFKELQPLFEAKYNQFQSNKETTPKTENCEEKKETTTEPNTANSKNVEVPKTDTPNDKEKTQEEIDKEFENETSSMFLTDTKQTVSTKKSEEVKFPETKVIPLREGEEKRQLQELVDNQTLNVLLEGYCATDNKKYKEILTEIRKVITKGNYPKRVVQAYLREIESKGYYCNTQDAMKPLEDTKEEKETTAETTSTPKGDSLEKFKESLDNIEKNVEENGNQLPFGNNPKSNHQDVDESNCYQSEEEKMAMACSCSYFNTKT